MGNVRELLESENRVSCLTTIDPRDSALCQLWAKIGEAEGCVGDGEQLGLTATVKRFCDA